MSEPFFVTKMKWTRNRWGDYFATAENAEYMITNDSEGRILTRITPYTGVESLPTNTRICKVKTLKEAQQVAERDRYLINTEKNNG